MYSVHLNLAQTVLTRVPSDTLATVNSTVFLECQASYDKQNKDLVYIWDINGREINFDTEHHFKLVSIINKMLVISCL